MFEMEMLDEPQMFSHETFKLNMTFTCLQNRSFAHKRAAINTHKVCSPEELYIESVSRLGRGVMEEASSDRSRGL